MYFKKLLVFLFILSSFGLKSQIYPLLFSESTSPISLNPASSGAWHDFHIHTTGHLQNFQTGMPFTRTLQFNLGYKIKGHNQVLQFLNRNEISVGLNHYTDILGENLSLYQNTSFSINKKIKLNKFNLNIGYALSYFKMDLNILPYAKLVDKSFMSDFGILLHNDKFFAGFSLNNAFKPVLDINFFEFYTAHLITANIAYKYSKNKFSIMPTMVYLNYGYQLDVLYSQVYFSLLNELITVGLGYALKNHFLFSLASQYKNYRISYNYGKSEYLIYQHTFNRHEVKLSFLVKYNQSVKKVYSTI